jgi:hypothetical protein
MGLMKQMHLEEMEREANEQELERDRVIEEEGWDRLGFEEAMEKDD